MKNVCNNSKCRAIPVYIEQAFTKYAQNELTAQNADYYNHVFFMQLNYI